MNNNSFFKIILLTRLSPYPSIYMRTLFTRKVFKKRGVGIIIIDEVFFHDDNFSLPHPHTNVPSNAIYPLTVFAVKLLYQTSVDQGSWACCFGGRVSSVPCCHQGHHCQWCGCCYQTGTWAVMRKTMKQQKWHSAMHQTQNGPLPFIYGS